MPYAVAVNFPPNELVALLVRRDCALWNRDAPWRGL